MRLPHNELCPECQFPCVICGGNANHKRFKCTGPVLHFHRVNHVKHIPVKAEKSGVIAGHWYHPENKPLHRDLFELRDLAMTAHK